MDTRGDAENSEEPSFRRISYNGIIFNNR